MDPIKVAIITYAIICVPAYFWLEGPVDAAGTVGPGVVVIALLSGSLLFVPVINAGLKRQFGRTGRITTASHHEIDE